MKTTKLAKMLVALFLSVVTIGAFALPTSSAYAEVDICGRGDVPQAVRDANGCSGGSDSKISNTIQGILNGIIGAAGLVAVIFIVIGGINYMTSAGDSAKVEKGKKTILYATIGLIICALSFAIVNWVIGSVLKQ